MNREETARHLRGAFFFRSLPDDLRERAAAGSREHQLEAGEPLWRAGQAAESFTVIVSGFVEIVRTAPSGEESLLGVFGPRESIGVPAVIDRTTYPADAVAVTDVRLLRVDASPVLDAIAERPEVSQAIHRALLDHTDTLRWKVDVMSAGSVPRRLAALLSHFAERFGDEDADGTVVIPVALSRAHLSRMVGARIETVVRTMSKWQKEGWLRTTKEGFEITSMDELEARLRG